MAFVNENPFTAVALGPTQEASLGWYDRYPLGISGLGDLGAIGYLAALGATAAQEAKKAAAAAAAAQRKQEQEAAKEARAAAQAAKQEAAAAAATTRQQQAAAAAEGRKAAAAQAAAARQQQAAAAAAARAANQSAKQQAKVAAAAEKKAQVAEKQGQRAVAQAAKKEAAVAKQEQRKQDAAAKKSAQQSAAADKRAAAAEKKAVQQAKAAARKAAKIAGKTISIAPGEEGAADALHGEITSMQTAMAKLAASKNAAKKSAAAKKAWLASAKELGQKQADFLIGLQSAGKSQPAAAPRAGKKLKGLFGLLDLSGLNALAGLGQETTNLDASGNPVDQGTYVDPNAQYVDPSTAQSSVAPSMGMPMLQMPTFTPTPLPAQCTRHPNKPICMMMQMSQQSQEQMQIFMTVIMQMQQQLMSLIQDLLSSQTTQPGVSTCPAGTVFDAASGTCVQGSGTAGWCQQGYTQDPTTGACVPMPQPQLMYDTYGQQQPYGYGAEAVPGISPYQPSSNVEPIPAGYEGGDTGAAYGGSDFGPTGVPSDINVTPGYGTPYGPQQYATQEQGIISSDTLPEGLVAEGGGGGEYVPDMGAQMPMQMPASMPMVAQGGGSAPYMPEMYGGESVEQYAIEGATGAPEVAELPAGYVRSPYDLGPLPGGGLPSMNLLPPEAGGETISTGEEPAYPLSMQPADQGGLYAEAAPEGQANVYQEAGGMPAQDQGNILAQSISEKPIDQETV